MNANSVVCIPVMIAHVLIVSILKEATTVLANLATKVMDRHANYSVIIFFACYYNSIALEILFLDDSTCDTICDHHCLHQRTEIRCVCDRGYYLASDGITCIGKI